MSKNESDLPPSTKYLRPEHLQLLALNFAREGETEELLKLVRGGIAVDSADGSKNSLLMLACYYGHAATARMLIEQGANVEWRNVRGQTPLGGVAFKGHDDVAAVLLEHGADPHADSGAGVTPTMFATMFERKKMLGFFATKSAAQ